MLTYEKSSILWKTLEDPSLGSLMQSKLLEEHHGLQDVIPASKSYWEINPSVISLKPISANLKGMPQDYTKLLGLPPVQTIGKLALT